MPTIEVSAALAAAKKVDEAVGLIGKLVSKLKRNPDAAALKLGLALDEIARTYQAVDGAIAGYLSLGIDPKALESGSKTLLDIEGGALSMQVEQGRGHCHVISNIYYQHLDRWFARVLELKDYDAIGRVFHELGNADDDVFAHLAEVARVLERDASTVLDTLVTKDPDAARRHIREAREQLKPLRLAISSTMRRLYELKTEFIELTGTT